MLSLRLHTIGLSVVYGLTSITCLEHRVYGGEDIRYENHKHLARLDIYRRLLIQSGVVQKMGLCSGSIISPNWIISANHCFSANTELVRVLHYNPDKDLEIIAEVLSSKIFRYPSYKINDKSPSNLEKDLALLKTSLQITFNDYVRPIALSTRTPDSHQVGIMSGYGMAELYSSGPAEGTVEIGKYCTRILLGSTLLCSLSSVRAAAGDSGGPLVSSGVLVGIISASCTDVLENKKCLTVYVDVATNVEWTRRVITAN